MPDFGGSGEVGPAGGGIGFYRYEHYSLEEKIGWMGQGPGAAELAEAQSALADLGNDLIESEQTLRELVNSLGGEWSGSAGTSAGEAMLAAASWSADSAPVAGEAGSQVGLQSESVERTRYGMPSSAPKPEYGFGDAFGDAFNMQTGNLFDVQTDFDEQVAQRRAADEAANRLLYQYEAATRANLAAIPVLAEVPVITVESEPPRTEPLVARERSTDWNTLTPPEVRPDETTKRERTEPKDPDQKPDEKPGQEPDQKPGQKPEDRPEQRTVPEPGQEPEQVSDQRPNQEIGEPPQYSTTPNHSGVTPSSFVPDSDRSSAHVGSSGARGGFGPTGGLGGGLGGLPGGFGGFGPGAEPSVGRGPAGAASGGARVSAAGARSMSGVPGRGAGGGSLMSPVTAGGARGGDEDAEHTDRYFSETDELFRTDDLRVLNHSVLGEDRES
jgi:hypothetical protein